MSKCIILVTNFQKLPGVGFLSPQGPFFFDFDDLKLRDLAKFCFFKLIMTKSNFKKSVMTSFHKLSFHIGPLPIKI